MSRLRAAVIGCGHFGRYHADKYAAAPEVELVGVVDADRRAAEAVAAAVGCAAAGELAELAGRVDVASVVVPTHAHLEVARTCLEAGLHILVEKPVAATAVEARAMIDAAAAAGRILQVGHLERFNPAITALGDVIDRPMFVESTRIAPFKPRGTDVDVILDLMIHDIDLIQHLIDAPLASVDAIGVPVLSRRDDIANARLHFVGGCVVNVTASRVSLKSERKMRLFQREAYISIDFQARHATIARRGQGEMFPGVPDVRIEQRRFEAHDALALEIEAFLAAVRGERPVAVTGEDGLRALQTAEAITSAMLRPV
ncbi:MAG TPA: Gfo/Idh/MocA family oxidoreductase [Geminicoccaceae bacterium]